MRLGNIAGCALLPASFIVLLSASFEEVFETTKMLKRQLRASLDSKLEGIAPPLSLAHTSEIFQPEGRGPLLYFPVFSSLCMCSEYGTNTLRLLAFG